MKFKSKLLAGKLNQWYFLWWWAFSLDRTKLNCLIYWWCLKETLIESYISHPTPFTFFPKKICSKTKNNKRERYILNIEKVTTNVFYANTRVKAFPWQEMLVVNEPITISEAERCPISSYHCIYLCRWCTVLVNVW